MADQFEHPGHGEPEGGAMPPDGDFPADFFDDAPDPTAELDTVKEPPQAQPPFAAHEPEPQAQAPASRPEPAAPPGREPDPLDRPPVPGAPSTFKPPRHEPDDDHGSRRSAFPAIMGFVMLGVLAFAVYYGMQKFEKPPAAPVATPSADEAKKEPATEYARAEHAEKLDARINDLSGKLDDLAAQIKALDGKLADQSKSKNEDGSGPDVKAIEGKVDSLSKAVAGIGPLREKVDSINGRVGSVDDAVKSLRGDLASLKDEVGKLASSGSSKPAGGGESNDATPSLSKGIDLFNAGKYEEANEFFKKVESTDPKDARVYYYAALTNGLTTKDWQGETLKIAEKGAEQEKAGHPKASEIDAAFADVPASLKPWVAFFRSKAK